MDPQQHEDDYADTQVLEIVQGVAPAVTSSGRNQQDLPKRAAEDELEALYQEYVNVCEQAGAKANR